MFVDLLNASCQTVMEKNITFHFVSLSKSKLILALGCSVEGEESDVT
jgi:hypothetical protein